MGRRYTWGLENEKGEIVLVADSADKLGAMIGVSGVTVQINAERGQPRTKDPYCRHKYVKLPFEGKMPYVPTYSVEYLREHGTAMVWSSECPCTRCQASQPCSIQAKCAAIRIWTGNTLRAMRLVTGLSERYPDDEDVRGLWRLIGEIRESG